MKFGPVDRLLTGMAVPVSALQSAESCGVGEFLDLPLLGRWCRTAGLGLIQILPVNDTGTNSSPYSSLSAFALHPLYLRLQAVPGTAALGGEIDRFRSDSRGERRFSYAHVLEFKVSILTRVFRAAERDIREDPGLARWRAENPWHASYSVFKALKAETREAPWASWAEAEVPSEDRLRELWSSHEPACLFHAWVQYLLEGQLVCAARALEEMGIRLKGDIPILMSEESADVWAERRFFDLSARAGAPPDMYSTDGQNWGFPVYDWDALAGDGYRWWKNRLAQAEKFFHAFRIDHVLGFFRIWSIPREERRGLLGGFSPSVPVTRAALEGIGFDSGRIRWLSVPHVGSAEIRSSLGDLADRVLTRYLDRVGGEELYTLKPEVDAEQRILDLAEDPRVTQFLLARHGDRALLASGSHFLPAWYFWEASSFRSLGTDEQARLRELISKRRRDSETVWEERGRRLLRLLRDSTGMLVCAEDLGDVPGCVPRVLEELGILGLRIARWARDYASPGAPFVHPSRYPRLSVCTGSVHDTSTLRGWWEEDAAEREAFFRHLGGEGDCPPRMTPELLKRILSHLLGARSLFCILQIQDLLDLDPADWSADPAEDRINVPGTVSRKNWTWRMPMPLESLVERAEPAAAVAALARERSLRKPA
jgi:4-alpha-glucanotransferase